MLCKLGSMRLIQLLSVSNRILHLFFYFLGFFSRFFIFCSRKTGFKNFNTFLVIAFALWSAKKHWTGKFSRFKQIRRLLFSLTVVIIIFDDQRSFWLRFLTWLVFPFRHNFRFIIFFIATAWTFWVCLIITILINVVKGIFIFSVRSVKDKIKLVLPGLCSLRNLSQFQCAI